MESSDLTIKVQFSQLDLFVNCFEYPLIDTLQFTIASKYFEYVISSRIVNGKIPDYYGGIIEKSSSIVSS